MLIEATREIPRNPSNAPTEGLPPAPDFELPQHLRGSISGERGNEKGLLIETWTADMISLHPKVKEVIRHAKDQQQDNKGHDLTVIFVEDSGIEPINFQVKSRHENIVNYKNKLSQKLRKLGSTMTVDEWLVLDRTVPINGSKPGWDILYSFVLGVANILKNDAQIRRKHQYVELYS